MYSPLIQFLDEFKPELMERVVFYLARLVSPMDFDSALAVEDVLEQIKKDLGI